MEFFEEKIEIVVQIYMIKLPQNTYTKLTNPYF